MSSYLVNDIKSKCSGCGVCASICPNNCIHMIDDSEGFLYPYIDKENCISCGKCERFCPVINKKKLEERIPIAYAAFNRDLDIRMKSSSGGIFTLLAREILKNNGVVYGAALNNKNEVEHIEITKENDLNKLRGSKYLQSNVIGIYKKVKSILDKNREVLYTGTPCQVYALLKYLNKYYPNLFLQDIICHGVPSKKVWKKYITEIEKEENSKVLESYFRNKENGWKNYQMLIKLVNKKNIKEVFNKNSYMKLFLNNICLRPSCYDCSFKDANRISDITLADFWGIQNICPKMDDDKGTSLVIIHSQKGKELFERIKNNTEYKEVDFYNSIKYNPSMIKSAPCPKTRDDFFKDFEAKTIKELDKKYNKENIILKTIKKALRKLKRMVIK